MARAKSERLRSKAAAIEDLTHSIEQLQALIPKIEDLGREGFPYLEAARARTELQLREYIKRAFGEKSQEFQTHRYHKLPIGSPTETKHTVTLIKSLVAALTDKKLELQGLKLSVLDDAPPTQTKPQQARPQLTLMPPSPQATQPTLTSAVPVIPPPISTAVPSTTNVEIPPSPVPAVMPTIQAVPQERRLMAAPIQQLQQAASPAPPASVPPRAGESTGPAQQPPSAPPGATPPQPPTMQELPLPVQPRRGPATEALSAPVSGTSEPSPFEHDHLGLCKKLCQRFHAIARQLRLRGEYRATLAVQDEFDVQDLLHALLRVQFDDIGTDEWTPSYTNGAPRTTFLLNHDSLAIVVKKTRTGLSPKDLTDQVRVDIERYRIREGCTSLFCFIYDPEGRIGNPRGLEKDLTFITNHFTVDVLVAPK